MGKRENAHPAKPSAADVEPHLDPIPTVCCVVCGQDVNAQAAYWIGTGDTNYAANGQPLALEPMCEDCIVDLAMRFHDGP